MSKESTYLAAKTLLDEGWRAERITIVAVDGSRRQGWLWTDPVGGTSEIAGKWSFGPPKPRKIKLPPTWHMVFKRVSPRNIQFIPGTLPTPCSGGCGQCVPERLLTAYRGVKCCPACFEKRKVAVERGYYRTETFAARARAYMESQMRLGLQNAPEVMP